MNALGAIALCFAVAAPGLAAAQDQDAVAELAKICAETRCHPPGTIKVIMEDGATREFQSGSAWPIVYEGFVAIFPGATVFLAGEIVDGKVVNLRAVDEPETLVNVIKLEMEQKDGKPDTFLTVTNYFPETIKYRARMMLPTSDEVRETSSCAVRSGPVAVEHWPHPIFQLLLSDFRVVEASDGQIVCE